MDLHTASVVAGITFEFHTRGGYFRLLKGTGIFKIETDTGIHSDYIAGIGADLRGQDGKFFKVVRVTAKTSQDIQVLISEFPTTDSRLTGDIDINGLLSVATVGGNTVTESSGTLATATAATLLPADTDRIETVIYIDQDIFVSGASPASAASFPLPAGYHTIKNTAAIYMYNNSGALLSYKTLGDNK